MAAEKPFATEAAMCARFIAGLPKGWTAYPETAGFDILLSRDADGYQIGIEAKLKLNVEVVNQAIEDRLAYTYGLAGPDCRAVMVPEGCSGALEKICGYVGITIIRVRPERCNVYGPVFMPTLPEPRIVGSYDYEEWYELFPVKRHRLPEYVPDVAAGASAPLQLTDWKIAAIKIAVTLELRGFVTREDFKKHRIDHRRWVAGNLWLRRENGVYKANRLPDFKAQHPVVWAQIVADAPKWLPELARGA
jgi:hypothetical protein